jgi:hypothetical protein
MTDYEWEIKECLQQRTDTISYKKTKDQFFYPINEAKRKHSRMKQVRILFYLFREGIIQLFLIIFTGIKSKFKYK